MRPGVCVDLFNLTLKIRWPRKHTMFLRSVDFRRVNTTDAAILYAIFLDFFRALQEKTREVPIGLTMHYLCPFCLCCIARCRHIWRLARICSCVSIQQSCLPHQPSKKQMSLNGKNTNMHWHMTINENIWNIITWDVLVLINYWERERDRQTDR